MKCYAVRVRDAELLLKSSSGGAFTALAQSVLAKGGCVFGCVWKKPEMIAVHAKAEDEEDLVAMRGSKYVRSDISIALMGIRDELLRGREVMFSGTPCQVAAVRKFIGKDLLAHLTTVELICHGAPDPFVWERYKRFLGGGLSFVDFKDKQGGWNDPKIRMRYVDGREVSCDLYSDSYVKAFECGLSQAEGCFSCPFKSGMSGADLTIGDFWGVEKVLPGFADDDRGASIVIVHTQKGLSLVRLVEQKCDIVVVNDADALSRNPNYARPLEQHSQYSRFWKGLETDDVRFDRLVKKCLEGPLAFRAWRRLSRGLKRRFGRFRIARIWG